MPPTAGLVANLNGETVYENSRTKEKKIHDQSKATQLRIVIGWVRHHRDIRRRRQTNM